MIWYDMVWYVLVHCVVRYEWYRRGAAKQPITGGMDESENKQDISVKLNPAQTYLDLTKGKKLYLTYFQYIYTSSFFFVHSDQSLWLAGRKRRQGIFFLFCPKKGELMNWPKAKLSLTAEWNGLWSSTTHWWPHKVDQVVHIGPLNQVVHYTCWMWPH